MGGDPVELRLPLSKGGRKRLQGRRREIKARLIAVGVDAAGNRRASVEKIEIGDRKR